MKRSVRRSTLTQQQRKVLENLVAGKVWDDHARGRSQHGGLMGTCTLLYRRGYVEMASLGVKITLAGIKALEVLADEPIRKTKT